MVLKMTLRRQRRQKKPEKRRGGQSNQTPSPLGSVRVWNIIFVVVLMIAIGSLLGSGDQDSLNSICLDLTPLRKGKESLQKELETNLTEWRCKYQTSIHVARTTFSILVINGRRVLWFWTTKKIVYLKALPVLPLMHTYT